MLWHDTLLNLSAKLEAVNTHYIVIVSAALSDILLP